MSLKNGKDRLIVEGKVLEGVRLFGSITRATPKVYIVNYLSTITLLPPTPYTESAPNSTDSANKVIRSLTLDRKRSC